MTGSVLQEEGGAIKGGWAGEGTQGWACWRSVGSTAGFFGEPHEWVGTGQVGGRAGGVQSRGLEISRKHAALEVMRGPRGSQVR